jgi:oligopeptide transport system ATP-binding protein
MSESLLRAENLSKKFPVHGGFFSKEIGAVKAVQNISFDIKKGETLGLVGESGCGKSTLGRCLIRLIEPTSGKIFFRNQDITNIGGEQLRELRRKMQIIFQDPYASLNPRMTIGAILEEPLIIHNLFATPAERAERVKELINLVGLRPEHLTRYHSSAGY